MGRNILWYNFLKVNILEELQPVTESKKLRNINEMNLSLNGKIKQDSMLLNFFMLNSTEHEISTAHKTKNAVKYRLFLLSTSQMLYLPC